MREFLYGLRVDVREYPRRLSESRCSPVSGRFRDTLVSHEWLSPHGGSENVFEAIAASLPGAALQCLWNNAPERFGNDVRETWLARTPMRRSRPLALPLLPAVWRSVSLEGFSRVIASSHAFGHQLATRAAEEGLDAYAYIHTPARYVWTPELDDRGDGCAARVIAAMLKRQDARRTSDRVHYAANSEFVRDRIARYWGRAAEVIYPPVAVEMIQSRDDWSDKVVGDEVAKLETLPTEYVLGASRLVRYKRLDLAIELGELLEIPVVVVGSGPMEQQLRELANSRRVPVVFMGSVSNQLLYTIYQRASLLVFMAVEDFGIVPVEAMAAGTPVLVSSTGGSREGVELVGGGVAAASTAIRGELRQAAIEAFELDPSTFQSNAALLGHGAFAARIHKWIAN